MRPGSAELITYGVFFDRRPYDVSSSANSFGAERHGWSSTDRVTGR
jgi:hypothetical protein